MICESLKITHFPSKIAKLLALTMPRHETLYQVRCLSDEPYSGNHKTAKPYDNLRRDARSPLQKHLNNRLQTENIHLKQLLDSNMREIFRLRESMDISKIRKESFDHEFRMIEKKCRESDNEKRSLITLVDMSNNLIANYENLIVKYRRELTSSKEEVEVLKAENDSLKKLSKEREIRKQNEVNNLSFILQNELKEKHLLWQSLQEMKSIVEQYQEQIYILECFMSDCISDNQKHDVSGHLPMKSQFLGRTVNRQSKTF